MNIHLSRRGLLILSLFTIHCSLFIAFNQVFALPEVRTSPCPACHGKRSLSLTPPNLGQFDGEIGVAPGVPFKTHRFDVKYDRCPLCNGSGRHEHMTMQRLPPPADSDATTPCASCFATGARRATSPAPSAKATAASSRAGFSPRRRPLAARRGT